MLHWLMLLGLMNPAALAEEAKREIAETRQEQDQIQRERERAMHLRPVPAAGAPVIVRGAGFYSRRSRLTTKGIYNAAKPADGMSYENDIRLSFACSDAGVIGTIPAKFKNIQWKIKGDAPITDIQKGLVQTDEGGLAIIKVNSNLKDLEGISIAVEIEGQKLNVLLGTGPYVFEGLPMSICKLPKAINN